MDMGFQSRSSRVRLGSRQVGCGFAIIWSLVCHQFNLALGLLIWAFSWAQQTINGEVSGRTSDSGVVDWNRAHTLLLCEGTKKFSVNPEMFSS